jgi:hypothetical protein
MEPLAANSGLSSFAFVLPSPEAGVAGTAVDEEPAAFAAGPDGPVIALSSLPETASGLDRAGAPDTAGDWARDAESESDAASRELFASAR